MKTMKRFSAVLIAIFMMVSMMVIPASAAGEYSITITHANANHTYNAYQIFKGDLHDGILSNIVWGDGVSTDGQNAMGTAAGKASSLTTEALALEFAHTLVTTTGYLQNPITSSTLTNGNYVFSNLDAGYYLVVDTLADGKLDEAISQYIIQVVGNVSMQPKSGVPSIKKLVSRDNSSYAEGISASIGDPVYYKTTISLHNQVNIYKNYYVQVVDDIPAGITFVNSPENIKVYVENGSLKKEIPTTYYTIDYTGNVLTVTFSDIHDAIYAATQNTTALQDKLVIYYTTSLNKNAVVGAAGNVNTAKVIYSDDPNEIYNGTGTPTGLGEATSDDATVYSYMLSLKKVDATESSTVLEGATFIFYAMEEGTTEKYMTFDETGLLTGYTSSASGATPVTTDENGMLTVKGLASDTYWVHETVAPDGYNLNASDSAATFQGALDGNTGKLGSMTAVPTNASNAEVVLDDDDSPTGEIILTVTNQKGATLPTTGGVGTTIFYGIGGLLVIGALSLLLVRKRSAAK